MGGAEYAELRADVAAHGLRQPIVLFEHMVLDGRHRLRACEDESVEPRFEEYAGDEPAAHVLSLNLHRRHLSVSQRAMIAVAFLEPLEEEARRRQGTRTDLTSRADDREVGWEAYDPNHDGVSGIAGAAVGVSGSTVRRAKRVAEEAPDLAERVRSGEMAVVTAYDALRREPQRPKPDVGRVSARSAERIAQQAGALAMAVDALNLQKSCDRLSEDDRTNALQSCKRGLKALNALANALGR